MMMTTITMISFVATPVAPSKATSAMLSLAPTHTIPARRMVEVHSSSPGFSRASSACVPPVFAKETALFANMPNRIVHGTPEMPCPIAPAICWE